MSMKLKALGLGLLAAMAMSAFAVVNASAKVDGHFTSDKATTTIKGTENATHQVKFSVEGGTTIECKKVTYSGTVGSPTVTQITITPTYAECQTTGGTANAVTVTMNDCDYVFYSQGKQKHGTVTVNCPEGKKIEIHHPNCTISIGTQHALSNGIAYTNTATGITANVTVGNIAAEYHNGLCSFLGTNHTADMARAAIIEGESGEGSAHITAT